MRAAAVHSSHSAAAAALKLTNEGDCWHGRPAPRGTPNRQTSLSSWELLAARHVFKRGAARATAAAGWPPLSGSKLCQAGAPRLPLHMVAVV